MKKIVLLFLILLTSAQASVLWELKDGIDIYNSGNYKNSLRYFTGYIRSNPNDEDGYYWLGKIYQKQNNEKMSLAAFKKAYAIALKDKNIDKIDFENNEYDNLEDYFDMASGYYEQANYKEAENYANMMLKIDPDCASAYFIKAKIAYIENNKNLAFEYLKNAVLLDNMLLNTKLAHTLGMEEIPELSPQELIFYAQKTYYKGDVDSSIVYLKKYIELDKNNADAYKMLIDCYLKNNNPKEAENTLSEGRKNCKNAASLLISGAEIENYINKNSEKYKEILHEAYEINPNNKELLLKLGNLYISRKEYLKAKNYFETLISVDDSLYEAYFGYIYTLIKTNDTEKVQSSIKILSSFNKDGSEIYYLLSLICSHKAQYKDALDYIKMAIKKEQNPYYYAQAGKLYYILGDYKLSQKYLNNAINYEDSREYLILDNLKLDNLQKVKELVNSCPELDKNRISYKYYLYKTYKYNNKELNMVLKQKPFSMQDYIDLARINFLEGKKNITDKILSNASKKFNNAPEFLYLKQELEYIN